MLLDANTIRITNSSSLVSGTPYSIFLSLEGDVTVVQFSFRPKSGNPKESYNYILAKSDTVAASATTNNSNNLNGGTG